jgi:hypothetical protein
MNANSNVYPLICEASKQTKSNPGNYDIVHPVEVYKNIKRDTFENALKSIVKCNDIPEIAELAALKENIGITNIEPGTPCDCDALASRARARATRAACARATRVGRALKLEVEDALKKLEEVATSFYEKQQLVRLYEETIREKLRDDIESIDEAAFKHWNTCCESAQKSNALSLNRFITVRTIAYEACTKAMKFFEKNNQAAVSAKYKEKAEAIIVYVPY